MTWPRCAQSLPPEQRPVTRTYTVRRGGPRRAAAGHRFVVHGADGIAAPWAAGAEAGRPAGAVRRGRRLRARPGQRLAPVRRRRVGAAGDQLGPRGARPPTPAGSPTWRRSDAEHAVDDAGCRPGSTSSGWTAEPGTQPQLLADAVSAGPWLAGRVGVFAHGERESMKAVRAALHDSRPRGGTSSRCPATGPTAGPRTGSRPRSASQSDASARDQPEPAEESRTQSCSSSPPPKRWA